jgi:hypothetical protein
MRDSFIASLRNTAFGVSSLPTEIIDWYLSTAATLKICFTAVLELHMFLHDRIVGGSEPKFC